MNDEKIEKQLYATVVNMFELSDDKSSEGLVQTATQVREMFVLRGIAVTDAIYAQVLAELENNVSVDMLGSDACIRGHYEHTPWLRNAVAEDSVQWRFWRRYEMYLHNDKHWPAKVVNALDKSATNIVDLMGNPQDKGKPFLRKGLVIGDVQSGKTATYTAICNKAADAGYKVIIVLTGILEDLRRQTQRRLDMEFSGRDSYKSLEQKTKPTNNFGVAKYDKNLSVFQLTSTVNDFKSQIADTLAAKIKSIDSPVLFVLKKQRNVLKNLALWLRDSVDDSTGKIMQPLLLIDDEADNASVNTKDDDSPTVINKSIRALLDMFYQAAYVGVTATPFANIFIQPDTEDAALAGGDSAAANRLAQADLFPSDFIYALDTPSSYIGATKIFGDSDADNGSMSGKNEDMLCEIDADNMESLLPYKHKKTATLRELPRDLKTALNYFLLVNAIRDARGDTKAHRSMMIHISRFKMVQRNVYELVDDWLAAVKSEIDNYARLADSRIAGSAMLNELKAVYEKFALASVEPRIGWRELRQKYLRRAVLPIQVRLQNSDSKESLDYEANKDGLRVIAVGGNSFSRGLTLEGLCVTFFYRRSLMYDTLMQMGRWFGYRPNYDDLCRVWLAPDAIGWYRYITMATEDLKDQIRQMQRLNLTPSEFGLKVRRHPASLIVTARNKMRTAGKIQQAITVSGSYIDSPRLIDDKKQLQRNYDRFVDFVAGLPDVAAEDDSIKHPTLFWRGVSGAKVAALLRGFASYQWQLSFQPLALSSYVTEKMADKLWDVGIIEGHGAPITIQTKAGTLTVNQSRRSIRRGDGNIMIGGTKLSISSVGLAKIGLTKAKIAQAETSYRENHDTGQAIKNIPNKAYMLKGRRPLLLLYFIEPLAEREVVTDFAVPLCAMSIGFPSTGEQEETVEYVANMVELKSIMGVEEDDEDGEG